MVGETVVFWEYLLFQQDIPLRLAETSNGLSGTESEFLSRSIKYAFHFFQYLVYKMHPNNTHYKSLHVRYLFENMLFCLDVRRCDVLILNLINYVFYKPSFRVPRYVACFILAYFTKETRVWTPKRLQELWWENHLWLCFRILLLYSIFSFCLCYSYVTILYIMSTEFSNIHILRKSFDEWISMVLQSQIIIVPYPKTGVDS